MKNLFCSLLSFIIIAGVSGAHAETMCVRDDTVAVVLDPTYGGTAEQTDNANGRWSVQFSYGKISGISECRNKNASGSTLNQNQACWCQMTKPAMSKWVFYNQSGSVDDCLSRCTGWCASYIRQSGSGMRKSIYASVGQ